MLINLLFSLKQQLRGARWYALTLFLYAWMLMAVWPTMSGIDLNQYLSMFPPEFLEFFGGSEAASLSTPEGFISLEFLSLFFILIIGFHFASAAGAAIAGAIESHTMDFKLSQPISRPKLILGELVATILSTGILVWVTVVIMWALSVFYKVGLSNRGLIIFGFLATIFLITWIAIAFFFSTFLKSKMAVAAATLGLMIALYTLTALSGIAEKIEKLSNFSLFRFYTPQELLTSTTPPWLDIAYLLLISLVLILLAIRIFSRRDV